MSDRRLPAGWGLWASVAVLSLVLAVGLAAYARQLSLGDITTSLRTLGAGGVVWGLYIVMDGCCLGAGVALMVCACLARFSRERDLEEAARIAMPSALACFLAAALSVMADQGRPLAALWYLGTVARPRSPLFATSMTVGAVCLCGSLVHCVLARRPDLAVYAGRPSFWRPLQRLLAAGFRGSPGQWRRRRQVGFWMSLFMLVALLVPLLALTVAFTVRPGRPLTVVVAEAVAFILCAGVAGLSVLLVAAGLVGRLAGPAAGLGARGFRRLGRALLVLDALALLAAIVSVAVASVSGEEATVAWAQALLGQPYGLLFWSQLALLALPASALLWLDWRRRLRPQVVVAAGALSVAAVFLHCYGALVAWQTHGLALPYPAGAYCPSATEIAVAGGIVALSLLLLLPSVRLIPFAPVARKHDPGGPATPDPRRLLATLAWALTGLVLAATGLVLSLRVGAEPFADPIVLGSPLVFLAGLLMLVTTGALYELVPDRESPVGDAITDGGALAAAQPRRT